jgi:hypothetical protein
LELDGIAAGLRRRIDERESPVGIAIVVRPDLGDDEAGLHPTSAPPSDIDDFLERHGGPYERFPTTQTGRLSLPGLTGRSSTPGRWLLDRPVNPGDDREVGVSGKKNALNR